MRGRIGYLGHEPLLYRELSGRENLVFHARLHGVAEPRVDELLARGGDGAPRATTRCATSRAGWCSGSPPHARCCTSRRCSCSTSRWSSLDPGARELLEPLIGRASGRTRVLVSHDLEAGAAESDLALGLRAGRQAWLGAGGRGRAQGPVP